MSIGKLQKTHGHEVYAWAQECLSHEESVSKADLRCPRTDREIAAKLIKTCKTGKFGILFPTNGRNREEYNWWYALR